MHSVDPAVFHERLKGTFTGMLQWQQLDALWARAKSGTWYFYQLGEELPVEALNGDELARRIDALDALLRRDHDYSYCGIVYADDAEHPTLIKVYDPNNMGSSCSGKAAPSPPGWILSTIPPALIETHASTPNNRRRWWQLFAK
ncbi:hypothetical protein [Sideroxydans lithotrophicus]|uniref:Uncharacterized protein n=1 Tax=Sideroxydans lithotrophicus (strain ES-1) TaxID=580332 RepID=D5CQK5_SIDLE|nr:hypothetical protein [Sideroxydans lithotrophicus]ADE11241.1 conserved hypothetical protein [Sideroxydans lithotrophicus ES-1]